MHRLSTGSEEWQRLKPPGIPPAPTGGDITVEGDEVYTRVSENFPPESSEG